MLSVDKKRTHHTFTPLLVFQIGNYPFESSQRQLTDQAEIFAKKGKILLTSVVGLMPDKRL
jgi:hypothetical protein